jgi:hypothetical protein
MVIPGHDMGQSRIVEEQQQVAFWQGMREVIRDELARLLDERGVQ